MGKRNRERRAAKQKDRRSRSARQEQTSSWWTWDEGADRVAFHRVVAATLDLAAYGHSEGEPTAAATCGHALVAEFGSRGRDLDAAADDAVREAIAVAWAGGWAPSDLHELARRRLEPSLVALLAEAVLAQSGHYAPATLHPQWRYALAALPTEDDPAPGTAHLGRWANRHGCSRAAALAAAVEVLALLGTLPRLEPLLPLPGTARFVVPAAPESEVGRKALAKVRALLAKAESTEFPEEAEALSAKAQELMSRYSLHQAMLDHDRGAVPTATGRRLWLDAPYAGAKALLVQSVAMANRCRTVWTEHQGFVTVVGAEAELESVELLTTSLLLQANRAMLAAGRQTMRDGTSRTRSFRQSFLVAYATRIGERLREASAAAGSAEAAHDSRLLPVLAARSRAADDLTARLFPEMVHRTVPVSNGAGWGAGRAAADLAMFDVCGAIAG